MDVMDQEAHCGVKKDTSTGLGDNLTKKRVKKNHTAASRGSRHVLQQSKKQKVDNDSFEPQKSLFACTGIVTGLGLICKCSASRKSVVGGSCYAKHFEDAGGAVDLSRAAEYMQSNLEVTRTKNKEEKGLFLFAEFKRSIVATPARSEKYFENSWTLPGPTSRITVCRQVWCQAYNFSPYLINKCSQALRDNSDATAFSGRPYDDSTLHGYTYNETEEMMIENVTEECADGSATLSNDYDSSWIRSANTPLSEPQQYAAIWIEEHFSAYGDHSPNSQEIHLSAPSKKAVFKDYECEMLAANLPVVKYKRFVWVKMESKPTTLISYSC